MITLMTGQGEWLVVDVACVVMGGFLYDTMKWIAKDWKERRH